MIFKKIILKNFKSHKYTNINFDKGITIIVGENGVGKSSILEGITYALFKKSTLNQNDLITIDKNNERSSTMYVELIFENNGINYKVVRTNNISKSTSKLYQKINKNFTLLVEGNSEVNKMLSSIIDIDIDLFLNAIYIRQGEITDLISKKPAERKKLITRFLKIDDLEKCWERMPKIINVYNNKKEKLEGMLISKENVATELQTKKELLISLNEELNKQIKNKNDYDKEKEEIAKEKEILDDKKSQYLIKYNKLNNNKKELNRLISNQQKLSLKIEEINEYENDLKIFKNKLSELSNENFDDKIINLKSENVSLENINKTLKKSLDDLLKVENECPICKSKITEEKKNELELNYRNEIKNNLNKINSNEENIKELKDKNKNYNYYNNKIIELKTLIKDKEEYKDKLDNVLYNINIKNNDIKNKEDELYDLEYDENKYNETVNNERNINKKISKNFENIGVIKGKISNTETRIEELKQDLVDIENIKMKIKKLNDFIDLLNEFRTLYGRDGIQNNLRVMSKDSIQKNTNMFFEKFNFDYSYLKIDDDFKVSLFKENKEIDIDMLSGGEKIAIALSLRLGITQTVAKGNIDCIFLDEPTIHLDEVRIEELNNLLINMNIIPQMIIVTHNQKLENLGDNLIRIKKYNGVSKVIL